MDREQAIDLINSSLREGAELRTVVARDCSTAIFEAAGLITTCLRAGGKLLFFGNGGSAADAQHLAAEFVGRFVRERAGLPAIALTTDSSILTAVGNDYGFDQIFARQVQALGRPGDVAIAISTSGNSPNIIEGVKAARKGYSKDHRLEWQGWWPPCHGSRCRHYDCIDKHRQNSRMSHCNRTPSL